MAATPDLAYAAPTSSAGATRAVRSSSLAGRAGCLVAALVCVAAGLAIASAYPIAPFAALALFAAWTAFATVRFALALPASIALVPVVGFATWTGWLTIEETDLIVLALAAGGYAARAVAGTRATRSDAPRLSIVSIVLLALFFASTAIALARGIDAAGGLRLDAFDLSAGYDSPQNALRIFKSFAFALLLAPLVLAELRSPGGFDRFGAGMTAALGLASVVVLQERLAFTGLLDFSGDYRVTGSFWEMHVGGAALDGFLALTIPFAIREVFRHANPLRFALAALVLSIAAYAALVTFSRGTYVAIPLSLIALVVLVGRQRVRIERGAASIMLMKAVAFAVVVGACGFIVFKSGGYRAVLASFVVLACAMPADAALRRLDIAGALISAIAAFVLVAGGFLAAGVLPKGPYVVFAAATVAVAAAVVHAERSPLRSTAIFIVAGWLWLAASAVAVARHWGGSVAFHDSAVMLAALVVLTIAASRLPRSIWPQRRREQLVTMGVAGIVLGTVAVFTGGAYMGDRFSNSNDDVTFRLGHWRSGIDRLHGSDWLFGKGLGRFPATSLFEGPDSLVPGTDHLVQRDGQSFVQLTSPRVRYLGFNELFRMSQRIAIAPNTAYVATVETRASGAGALHVEACEKHLIYNATCRAVDLTTADTHGAWTRQTYAFDSGPMGASPWWEPRPVFFALASYGPVEVRRVHLTGPGGVEVLVNGDFTDRLTRWFVSSDRHHLPWHIKNLVLDVLFDQGAIGLALFVLLAGGALLRTAIGRAHRHPDAPFIAAALVGYLAVGVFDSLLDVPREALLFYLVVLVALMLRNPHVVAAPKVAVAPPPIDEKAERARRRQSAFGARSREQAP